MNPAFSIFLEGRLPGLNEVTAQNRRNRYAGAKQKKAVEDALLAQLHGIPTLPAGCAWRFTWYEADRRRDPDNIASAVKFIFDALQAAGAIANDNWQYVGSIAHRFRVQTPVGVLVEAFLG
jgi:hypothetical protein